MIEAIKARLKRVGWKTILASVLLALLGLADVFQAIDLNALFSVFIHDEAKVGSAVAITSVLFGILRLAVGVFGISKEDASE
jgi:hypothetical protein